MKGDLNILKSSYIFLLSFTEDICLKGKVKGDIRIKQTKAKSLDLSTFFHWSCLPNEIEFWFAASYFYLLMIKGIFSRMLNWVKIINFNCSSISPRKNVNSFIKISFDNINIPHSYLILVILFCFLSTEETIMSDFSVVEPCNLHNSIWIISLKVQKH